jgi:sugar phosphate isomerase/epimerase
MKNTRREFLKSSAALVMPSPHPKWNAGRLGIMCQVGADEKSTRTVFAAALSAGFSRAQINFPWAKADRAYLSSLPSWLKEEGLKVDALGAYVNCCHPETDMNQCGPAEFAKAIEYASMVGCRQLVAWTGGYSTALHEPEPRNQTPAAVDAIQRFVEKYVSRLQDARLNLALESYINLVCPDASALISLLRRLPTCATAVLDPPNLTPLSLYSRRDQVLLEMVATLRERIGVVHLKDFRLAPGARRYDLPGPMAGEMNYPLFAKLILDLPGEPPLVVEHVKPEQFAETRRKLLPVFAAHT